LLKQMRKAGKAKVHHKILSPNLEVRKC